MSLKQTYAIKTSIVSIPGELFNITNYLIINISSISNLIKILSVE